MDISVHAQPNAHPVKTEWVDGALAGVHAAGDPLGALVGRPLAPGDGIMLVGWPDGGSGRYHVIESHAAAQRPRPHHLLPAGPRRPADGRGELDMTTMTTIAAGTWTVDVAHTRAAFAARHLFGSTVRGTITVTAGTIEVAADGRPVRLHATLDPASIDTGNTRRDSDLRGKRFLAVDACPLMEIAADQITPTAQGWHADAVLRVHGREAPVRIDATLAGTATVSRLHVNGTARLDLRDAGIRVPGWLVRRFVDLTVSAQLTRPA